MNELLKMHLQMFADGEEEKEESAGSDNSDKEGEQKQQEPKEETFTKAQMEEIITKRVAREKDAATKKIQEAEKLAKMNADEKQKYEFEQLQAKIAEFEKKDQYYSLSKEANKMLAEHDIQADDELLQLIVKDTADDTNKAVQSFVTLFNAKVEQGVNKALTGKSPRMNNLGNNATTKDSIMSIKDASQRIKAIQDNPQLFKQ